MAEICIENLSFSYPESERQALREVSFTVRNGEFAVVCGASGSGKSTLLRMLKPSLRPHGSLEGSVLFSEKPLETLSQREECEKIGFVSQSPENQIVTDKVWHELAFGLESLGLSNEMIRRRVAEVTSFFGLEEAFEKNVSELSGGQKQLVTLASVMAMQPEVLILDEPTSQLDPVAASEFLSCLSRINRELGVTVILCEQRLEEVFSLCDRAVLLENGRVTVQGTPAELFVSDFHSDRLLPSYARIWHETGRAGECPLTIAQGREWLKRFVSEHEVTELYPEEIPPCGETVLEMKNVWFRYQKDSPDVLRGLDFKIRRGEFIAVLGGNGAGKSTLLSVISGILKPYSGKVKRVFSRCAMLPQYPRSILSGKSVRDSLAEITSDKKLLSRVTSVCCAEELLDRHPFDLSGGETQRAALAKTLLTEPDLLLLDEPTKGLDNGFKEQFASIIKALTDRGVTVVMVSHDVEFCAKHPHRCLMMFGGELVAEDTPRGFFRSNSFYVTSARRIAKGTLDESVTTDDVLWQLTGKREEPPEPPDLETASNNFISKNSSKPNISYQKRTKLPKRTVVASAMILLAIPLTIFIGTTYLNDERYLFISLLVLLEAMLPFFLVFEGRRPQARELILIAVLCAISVAGRAAFAALPQVKPVLALIIISGVALGGEAGFITGAVAMLVSNLYFGQGAWTPWQMFAAGIIGYLSGVLFSKGFLSRSRVPLCVFGFTVTLIIYGAVMNLATMVLARAPMNTASLIAYYGQGLPMDLIHALSTLVILFLISKPMLEKLDHVKTKYGLL